MFFCKSKQAEPPAVPTGRGFPKYPILANSYPTFLAANFIETKNTVTEKQAGEKKVTYKPRSNLKQQQGWLRLYPIAPGTRWRGLCGRRGRVGDREREGLRMPHGQ